MKRMIAHGNAFNVSVRYCKHRSHRVVYRAQQNFLIYLPQQNWSEKLLKKAQSSEGFSFSFSF